MASRTTLRTPSLIVARSATMDPRLKRPRKQSCNRLLADGEEAMWRPCATGAPIARFNDLGRLVRVAVRHSGGWLLELFRYGAHTCRIGHRRDRRERPRRKRNSEIRRLHAAVGVRDLVPAAGEGRPVHDNARLELSVHERHLLPHLFPRRS